MRIDPEQSRIGNRQALCSQRRNHTGQDVSRTGRCHARVTPCRNPRNAARLAHQRTAALQYDDTAHDVDEIGESRETV